MQFINYAIEFVFCAFVAHTAVHFASGLVSLWNSGKGDRLVEQSQDEEDWLESAQQAPELHPPMSWSDAIVKFARPVKSATVAEVIEGYSIRQLKRLDWETMTPYQLRDECKKAKIKWRNAYGKNKHLTKAQMVAALSEVNQEMGA